MTQKEWTIMIYMAGDNNLAVDMAYALEQIKGVAGEGPDSPNLFVYYDGNSPSIPTLYCDFSDPKQPKYVRSFRVPDKLMPAPSTRNENAAHRNSIINFVDWCVNNVEVEDETGEIVDYGRRARRYALIFSGHSLGFQDIGLFRDDTSGKTMKMTELSVLMKRLTGTQDELTARAKTRGLEGAELERETTPLLGQKLDILGFDSCVMGMLEVGYQFQDVAKAMIASEGSVPSAGWTYAKILGCLTNRDGSEAGARKTTENFVREFIKSQDAYTVGGVSVDMAAWDLSRLRDLARAFSELSDALLKCFDDPKGRIYRQMERVILQVHWKCQSYMYDQNVDLGDFCQLLAGECRSIADDLDGDDAEILEQVGQRCQRVLEELKNVVIVSGFSGGAYQYSNGVSIFFPWSREGYDVSKKNYESLWFAKDTSKERADWHHFLKKYLNEVALRKFEPVTPDAAPGERYRYFSGVRFYEHAAAGGTALLRPRLAGQNGSKLAGEKDSKLAGEKDSKLAGEKDSKLAGEKDSKLAGEKDSKLAGEKDSKLAGENDSKLAGEKDSKLAGEKDSKLAGEKDSKLAGEKDSKLAGEKDSKLAGEKDSKLAGEKDSKLAGEKDSKLAGEKDSKLAGEKDSKLAGEKDSKLAGEKDSKLAGEKDSKMAGGGGSNGFFDSLQLWKNIESRWNISGFTKRPEEPAAESRAARG